MHTVTLPDGTESKPFVCAHITRKGNGDTAGQLPTTRAILYYAATTIHADGAVLHKRAILATLLSRNLHMEGSQYDDSYLEGVQLSGVQLVPSAINEDHSRSEGSDEAMGLPSFDGEYRGSQTPVKGLLSEVIERVNEMFRVRNIDVAEGSVAGFISTFWGFLCEDETAQAMAKNNSPSQLKASADFSHAVGIAMRRTCQENQEIQSYMQDQSFLQNIVEITADALQAQHCRDGNYTGAIMK